MSDFGATLDAAVDNVFALAIALFLYLAMPQIYASHPVALAVLFIAPLLYLGLSWLMTGRVLMFHFHSARLGALLLFALWPLLELTGMGWPIGLTALVVGLSRVEQVAFILRGGRDQDARHVGQAVNAGNLALNAPALLHLAAPIPISWGQPTALARGPVVAAAVAGRNAIGVSAGLFAPLKGLSVASGALSSDHEPDMSGTEPAIQIGPFPQWSEPGRIVTFDPWGHRVAQDFAREIARGLPLRPSIAVTRGCLNIPEITAALQVGILQSDGAILAADGTYPCDQDCHRPCLVSAGHCSTAGD